ncbi:MAG TPA: hypothetical protein VLX92_28230 [Kofleriaceae bacterium]|nr:hypothetical protein [Kofleriaceae bacterium]
MRAAVLAVILAACGSPSGDGECTTDSNCGSNVCARDGECLPGDQVRMVVVTWTVGGQPASAATCASFPDLYLQFDGSSYDDSFGFDPVPCAEGQFTIDKIPDRFTQAELGPSGELRDAVSQIDDHGDVSFDLSP